MKKIMELQGFAKFHQLLKLDQHPSDMGFSSKVRAGDIIRFASRVRLAKSFKGINIDGYSQDANYGYNAFFLVFLTHSALERFIEISALNLDALDFIMAPYNPEKVIEKFLEKDKKSLLYNFIY
ncbi:hypothetical protein DSM106972_093710 [Dulcicalothrix desertica PCC 7102]|uniref:Uncharacterized protein n=1 Tax=Dulcicalothrix desertica PCC 7102 TaxID=232991 RepID=A0A3S1C337_9CYAN|nr:hypothetical protein [Dulcicalothrix desertica]RUS94386.1 hypothetical protein DSM106972_093710 [Dulcicalothrix desertica PCC 7102]